MFRYMPAKRVKEDYVPLVRFRSLSVFFKKCNVPGTRIQYIGRETADGEEANL